MARTKDRSDGRERARETSETGGTLDGTALQQGGLQADEVAFIEDRDMQFIDEFLPDFLDYQATDLVQPVLALSLKHNGDGWVVDEAGGSAGDPAGAVGRTTTTNQSGSPVQVASYTVSQGTTGRLEEVAGIGDEGGRIQFDIAGTTLGPFDAEEGLAMPFDGATLAEGEQVIVEAFTEGGTSREFNGAISAREI